MAAETDPARRVHLDHASRPDIHDRPWHPARLTGSRPALLGMLSRRTPIGSDVHHVLGHAEPGDEPASRSAVGGAWLGWREHTLAGRLASVIDPASPGVDTEVIITDRSFPLARLLGLSTTATIELLTAEGVIGRPVS